MKITPINFNKINSFKQNFKSNLSNSNPVSKKEETVTDKKIEAIEMLSKGKDVLLNADLALKIAQRKREEAENIYLDWQERKPKTGCENGATKEYLTAWDKSLNKYIETREDGSMRLIEYLYGEVVEILETDAEGKQNIFCYDKKAISRITQGKHSEIGKKQCIEITPKEFVFLPSQKLAIYREDYRVVSTYNKSQEFLGKFTTIKTAMHFNTTSARPVLETAKTGVFISPSGKRFYENDFKFGGNESLV